MLDESPFPHQGPLAPADVHGRDALVADLVERVTQRRVTALLGPRRYGKTSVLGKVGAIVEEGGASAIHVDLYETRSAADLAVRLDQALDATRGRVRRQLSTLAASSSINLGLFRVEFARPPAQRPDPDASLHLLLDVLVAAAASTPTVLIVDEFVGINGVPGAAGLLRTKLQHHVGEIGVLFAGSQPSAMTAMFSDQAAPFYAQADIVEIPSFSRSDLDAIVTDGFERTGRSAGRLAGLLHHLTAGHPYRSMQVADAAWRRTERGEPGDLRWAEALEAVRAGTAPGHETLFSTYSGPEQVVLRAVAGGRPLFGGTLELFNVSSGAVAAARDRLIAGGTIGRDLQIVDPLMADWIRRTLPL